MKHFTNFLMLAAIAVASLASCARELDAPEKDTAPEGYYLEEIFASYPSADTRTSFDGTTGKFSWSEGDEIAFHLSDGSYTVAEIDPVTNKVRLYIREGLTRDNFAVYPASAAIEEHATVGDMQVKLPDAYNVSENPTTDYIPMPMIATQDETNHLKFNHTGALLQLNLDIPAGTKTAKVSLGDKALSGTLTVIADGDYFKTSATSVDQVEDGGNTIEFTVSEDENGLAEDTQAYLRLPVSTGTYDEIKITYNNGEYNTYEFQKDVTLNFNRSSGKKLSIDESNFVDQRDYFWFEALEANSTVKLSYYLGKSATLTQLGEYYYSTDNKKNWNLYDLENSPEITISNVGERVYFRSISGFIGVSYESTGGSVSGNNYRNLNFQGTGLLKVGGNLVDLVNYKSKPTSIKSSFHSLFKGMSCLVGASELILPDYLSRGCYAYMFQDCTSLVSTPTLVATNYKNLGGYSNEYAYNAYQGMFAGCTSLVTAPELPYSETPIPTGFYREMFKGCTSLTTAPALPSTQLGNDCYWSMFEDCSSLVTAPDLPATRILQYSYRNMFANCTSLVNIPDFDPVEIKSGGCNGMFMNCTSLVAGPTSLSVTSGNNDSSETGVYASMFSGCTSLTKAPKLPAMVLSRSCYSGMFMNCTSLAEAPELPATSITVSCYQNMFNGCTSLLDGPELPAKELKYCCYMQMFKGCTSLRSITVHFTEWPPKTSAGLSSGNASTGGSETLSWTTGVPQSSSCKFNKPKALEVIRQDGYSNTSGYIPKNWTIYNLTEVESDI